jgi:preprotein translocase subunit SecG
MRIGKILQKFLLFTLALFFAVSLLIKVTKFYNDFGIKRADTEVKLLPSPTTMAPLLPIQISF